MARQIKIEIIAQPDGKYGYHFLGDSEGEGQPDKVEAKDVFKKIVSELLAFLF